MMLYGCTANSCVNGSMKAVNIRFNFVILEFGYIGFINQLINLVTQLRCITMVFISRVSYDQT
jgi:hypothetical protein